MQVYLKDLVEDRTTLLVDEPILGQAWCGKPGWSLQDREWPGIGWMRDRLPLHDCHDRLVNGRGVAFRPDSSRSRRTGVGPESPTYTEAARIEQAQRTPRHASRYRRRDARPGPRDQMISPSSVKRLPMR